MAEDNFYGRTGLENLAKMNVMFLAGRYPGYGGVEKITTVLANEFVDRGHHVAIASFDQPIPDASSCRLREDVPLINLKFPVWDKRNRRIFRIALARYKTDVIINQWAWPWYVNKFIRKAIKCLPEKEVKIVTVHHNVPNINSKIEDYQVKLETGDGFRVINKIKLGIIRSVSRWSLRKVYLNSDRFVILSDSFADQMKQFVGIKSPDKLEVIPNLIDLSMTEAVGAKRNEVLYVGRIEYNQKRTFRLLYIWEQLQECFPDWHLTIVGDGPDRNDLEWRIEELGLKNVKIVGFADPTPYYGRAKILVLTSEYEGFGIVILEAMSRGVVPVVLNSFSSLNDTITSEDVGIKVAYPFETGRFAKELGLLMADPDRLKSMSENALKIPRRFSVESVTDRWEKMLNKLIIEDYEHVRLHGGKAS